MNDKLLAPKKVVEVLFLYIYYFKKNIGKEKLKIWCPFENQDSNFVKLLIDKGNEVIYNNNDKSFFDYTKIQIDKEKYDLVISHPPTYLRNDILEKLYFLNIPFVLLLPLSTLESKKRNLLFKNYDIEIIRISQKIKFDNFNINCKFNFSYFCWKFIDKNQFRIFKLTFETI